MLVNRSIEYVAQWTHRSCEQLNGTAFLRICLANQNATFSGVRMNKKLTESFLEMCFEAVLEQKRGDANGPQLAYIYFEDARVAISD